MADTVNKFGPRWSMDGRHLTYLVAARHVVLIDRTGPNTWSPGRLVARDIRGSGALSPDGKWVLGSGSRVRLVPVDGGRDRVILDAPAAGEEFGVPQWSNDGKSIYAHVGQPDTGLPGGLLVGGPLSRIVAVPVAGGALRTLLTEDPSRPFLRGYFATDGRRVFFNSHAITGDVYVLELRPNPRP